MTLPRSRGPKVASSRPGGRGAESTLTDLVLGGSGDGFARGPRLPGGTPRVKGTPILGRRAARAPRASGMVRRRLGRRGSSRTRRIRRHLSWLVNQEIARRGDPVVHRRRPGGLFPTNDAQPFHAADRVRLSSSVRRRVRKPRFAGSLSHLGRVSRRWLRARWREEKQQKEKKKKKRSICARRAPFPRRRTAPRGLRDLFAAMDTLVPAIITLRPGRARPLATRFPPARPPCVPRFGLVRRSSELSRPGSRGFQFTAFPRTDVRLLFGAERDALAENVSANSAALSG